MHSQFAGNSKLQRLDLEGKGLGTAGATALAQHIDADTGLQHLILTGNSLGDDGAAAVAPALHNIARVTPSSFKCTSSRLDQFPFTADNAHQHSWTS